VGIGPGVVVDKQLMATSAGGTAGRPNLNSEFGGGATPVERGWNLRWQTLELRRYDTLSGYVWTELYDVEHEMAGIYTFSREPKDTGSNEPATTNADTVVIPDITPQAPGRDLAAGGGRAELDVRVSHHGTAPIDASIVAVWSAVLGQYDAAAVEAALADGSIGSIGATGGSVKVHPYRLSGPVHVSAPIPAGAAAARLHLVLVSAGQIVASTAVDVTT
jgi:hypothetical protein